MDVQKQVEVWKCNNCNRIEDKEEEVICWECGRGEMLYQGTTWIKAEPLPYPYTALEKLRLKPWRDSRPPDDLLLNLCNLLFWSIVVGVAVGLVVWLD